MKRLALILLGLLATVAFAAPPWVWMQTPPASGGGGPTTLIHDTFTGGAGTMAGRTPDTVNTPGNTWSVQNGAFTVDGSGNAEGNSAGAAPWNVVTINSGVADCTVATVGVFGSTASTMTGGLAVRYVDNSNFWICRMTKSDPELRIIERNGGTETERATGATIAIATSDVVAMWATANGTSITLVMTNLTSGLGTNITYSSSFNQTATAHGMISRGTAYLTEYQEFVVQTP